MTVEQINSGGTVTYLHHDQQGSTRLLTGSTGTGTGTASYDVYGNKTGSTGTSTTPLGYDAQYTSSDTSLVYLRARVYDPATAQFLSVDPLASATRLPYGYAGENALNNADPTGADELFETVVSWTATAVTAGVCLAPAVDLVACGPAIAANTAVQSALVATSSRPILQRLALITVNVALGGYGGLFAGIEQLAAERSAPAWIKLYIKGVAVILPAAVGFAVPPPATATTCPPSG